MAYEVITLNLIPSGEVPVIHAAQYDINRWLNVYLQLGNYLHRKNPIYYGYYTQGCHFLAGVKYVF